MQPIHHLGIAVLVAWILTGCGNSSSAESATLDANASSQKVSVYNMGSYMNHPVIREGARITAAQQMSGNNVRSTTQNDTIIGWSLPLNTPAPQNCFDYNVTVSFEASDDDFQMSQSIVDTVQTYSYDETVGLDLEIAKVKIEGNVTGTIKKNTYTAQGVASAQSQAMAYITDVTLNNTGKSYLNQGVETFVNNCGNYYLSRAPLTFGTDLHFTFEYWDKNTTEELQANITVKVLFFKFSKTVHKAFQQNTHSQPYISFQVVHVGAGEYFSQYDLNQNDITNCTEQGACDAFFLDLLAQINSASGDAAAAVRQEPQQFGSIYQLDWNRVLSDLGDQGNYYLSDVDDIIDSALLNEINASSIPNASEHELGQIKGATLTLLELLDFQTYLEGLLYEMEGYVFYFDETFAPAVKETLQSYSDIVQNNLIAPLNTNLNACLFNPQHSACTTLPASLQEYLDNSDMNNSTKLALKNTLNAAIYTVDGNVEYFSTNYNVQQYEYIGKGTYIVDMLKGVNVNSLSPYSMVYFSTLLNKKSVMALLPSFGTRNGFGNNTLFTLPFIQLEENRVIGGDFLQNDACNDNTLMLHNLTLTAYSVLGESIFDSIQPFQEEWGNKGIISLNNSFGSAKGAQGGTVSSSPCSVEKSVQWGIDSTPVLVYPLYGFGDISTQKPDNVYQTLQNANDINKPTQLQNEYCYFAVKTPAGYANAEFFSPIYGVDIHKHLGAGWISPYAPYTYSEFTLAEYHDIYSNPTYYYSMQANFRPHSEKFTTINPFSTSNAGSILK